MILPIACAWVRRQESIILKAGVPLSLRQINLATRLGILYPERIRLQAVSQVPPVNWLFRLAGEKLGIVSGQTIGMALRYGIFIREEHWGDRRLLAHELAHVAQYERLGGFHGFLKQYLHECINPGYPLGDLELEANEAESLASSYPDI
jgi:hypothetical protein